MVIVSAGNTAAAEKAFLNRPGVDALIGNQDRGGTQHQVGLWQRFVAERGGLLKNGIECLGNGTDLGNGRVGIASGGGVANVSDSGGLLAALDALAGGD